MKCEICNGVTAITSRSSYHYTQSGLDNVYLTNVTVRSCGSCGEKSLRIPRMLELHAAIGKAVALQPCPLRGQDIRFLRKQLGLSAKRWATFLRTDTSTLSRWENAQQGVGTQSDTLIRLLYFRVRDEQEGALTQPPVVEALAAVKPGCTVHLKVNLSESNVYQSQITVSPAAVLL